MSNPATIPQPIPQATATPTDQAAGLFPEPTPPAPPARKPSRFEAAIAKARAEIEYEPEWYWRVHSVTAGTNQIGAAIPQARQDGLDFDEAAAIATLPPGVYVAALMHDGRETPIFRRSPFTVQAAASAPAPAAPAGRFTIEQLPAMITAGIGIITGLRDLFTPRDALTVKDLLPLMQRQQDRTPVAEVIEGMEAIRRLAPGTEAPQDDTLAEVVKALAPTIAQAMAQRTPAPARPAPPRLTRPPQTALPRPNPAPPTPIPVKPAGVGAGESAPAPTRTAADLAADLAATPPIAQAIGFGAQHGLTADAIAPAIYEIIERAVPEAQAAQGIDAADEINATAPGAYADRWIAETPALAFVREYVAEAEAALRDLAAPDDDDDDQDYAAGRDPLAARLERELDELEQREAARAVQEPNDQTKRPGIDIPGQEDDDGNPRDGNPATAARSPRLKISAGIGSPAEPLPRGTEQDTPAPAPKRRRNRTATKDTP